jgi:hypothetical protein
MFELVFIHIPDAHPQAIAVYNKVSTQYTAGQIITNTDAEKYLHVMAYEQYDGYTYAYDLWEAAQTAAKAINNKSNTIGLAVKVNDTWYDADGGSLITCYSDYHKK